jgi:opacity protein-like surface antigen
MNRTRSLLTVCAVLAGLVGAAGVVSAGSSSSSAATPNGKAERDIVPDRAARFAGGLGYWLDGARALGLGLDVSRIQPNVSSKLLSPAPGPSTAPPRLIDTDLHFDAISFDLKLRWPSLALDTPSRTALQPYMSLGPALFVARPDDVAAFGALPSQRDVSLSLGVLGGAGLAWQLSENASLFGEYRFTNSGPEKLLPLGGRGTLGRDANTSDLLYGISVRF